MQGCGHRHAGTRFPGGDLLSPWITASCPNQIRPFVSSSKCSNSISSSMSRVCNSRTTHTRIPASSPGMTLCGCSVRISARLTPAGGSRPIGRCPAAHFRRVHQQPVRLGFHRIKSLQRLRGHLVGTMTRNVLRQGGGRDDGSQYCHVLN